MENDGLKTKSDYLDRLQIKFSILKRYIYANFLIIAADFVIIFIYQLLFMNVVNILVTISYLFSLLLTLYILRDNFNIVNRSVYKTTSRVIYTLVTTVSVLFLNMLYIIIFHGFRNIETIVDYFFKGKKNFFYFLEPVFFFISTFAFALYFSLNTCIPILIIFKMLKIKRKINKIGKLDGQDYSITSHIQLSERNPLEDNNSSVLNSLNY